MLSSSTGGTLDTITAPTHSQEIEGGQESLLTACPSYATLPAMARRLRVAAGGVVYHVLNRAVGRNRIFDDEGDYLAFEKVLLRRRARRHATPGILCDAGPLASGGVAPKGWRIIALLALAERDPHATVARSSRIGGHGALVSRPLQELSRSAGQAFSAGLPVCREEPGAGRIINQGGGLALVKRCGWGIAERKALADAADQWPVPAPSDWTRWVDLPGNQKELEALRRSVTRRAPFGEDGWVRRTAGRLRLESSLRDPHRPKRRKENSQKDS